jgi:hypothetical protein
MNSEILRFAWALLVAVSLYEQGRNVSPLERHMFIMRWLDTAWKRKLFAKSVAREISWFISEGRRLGARAGLHAKAQYIWHTGTGKNERLSDLRRVTSFFEALQMMGWKDKLLSDEDWEHVMAGDAAFPVAYLRKTELHNAFSADEKMIAPLWLKLSKRFDGVVLLAEDAALSADITGEKNGIYLTRISCD